jgi:hypothetical protein
VLATLVAARYDYGSPMPDDHVIDELPTLLAAAAVFSESRRAGRITSCLSS